MGVIDGGQGGKGSTGRRAKTRVRIDPELHLRRKATIYLLTACLFLMVLGGVKLAQLERSSRAANGARVVVLEGPDVDGLWFQIERQSRREGDHAAEGYRLTGSSSPARLMRNGRNLPAESWLEDGVVLQVGAVRYRFDIEGGGVSTPTLFRWPLEDLSQVRGTGGGKPAPAALGGWRRLDIGGDPLGKSGVRDRVYVPWEQVAAALPDDVAKARAESKGVAMVLPRDGDQFRAGDRVFRVAAELPGVRLAHPDGSSEAVPVVTGTPGPKVKLPLMIHGDRLLGPGFGLWFGLETASASEPILDGDKQIVGYQPRLLRFVTFREAGGEQAREGLVGGGARLVALLPGDSALHPVKEGGALPLTGAERFLFMGSGQLLGRFRAGPVPATLPDREFLRLARQAFATGVIYQERGFLVAMNLNLLKAVEALKELEGAPVPAADPGRLRAFLAPIARGEASGASDADLRAEAATLLDRLSWESPSHSWGLTDEARAGAMKLLKGLSQTSGAHLDAMLDAHNARVVPTGLWVAGRLESAPPEGETQSSPTVDLAQLEGWQAGTGPGDALHTDWSPAGPAAGVAMPPVIPTLEDPTAGAPPEPLTGTWRALSEVWQPAREVPGSVLVRRYRRLLTLPSPAEGELALAGPGHLQLTVDGAVRYRGAGMSAEGGPGVLMPLSLGVGSHTLQVAVTTVIPEADWPGRAGIKLEAVDGPAWSLEAARGAGWLLPGWDTPGGLASIQKLWRSLVVLPSGPGEAPVLLAGDGEGEAEGEEWLTRMSEEDPELELDAGEGAGAGEDGGGLPGDEPGDDSSAGPGTGTGAGEGAGAGDEGGGLPGAGPGDGSSARPGEGTIAASSLPTPPAPGAWLWLDEPVWRASQGGTRYVTFFIRTQTPGPCTLRLITSAMPRSASFNGQPLDVSSWGLRPPSTPLELRVEAPVGTSALRLELDQPAAPARRVVDSPVDFKVDPLQEARPVRFKPQAVTWSRSNGAGPMLPRAPIVDSDERSRPALVVERGVGALEPGQEVLLGEHHGRGDTTLFFPGAGDGPRTVLTLPGQIKVTWTPPPAKRMGGATAAGPGRGPGEEETDLSAGGENEAGAAGAAELERRKHDPLATLGALGRPLSFVLEQSALFFRQENPLRPPFLPFGGYRVGSHQRDLFRNDRDQLAIGSQRIEYITSHHFLVRGEVAVIGAGGIFGLALEPLPENLPDLEPGTGESLRLIAGKDGVSAVYQGAAEGALLFRPGFGALALRAGGPPVRLRSGDRLALPRAGAVFRYVERQGILAPETPAGEVAGFRASAALGLRNLLGDGEGTRPGIERVFDASLSGLSGAPQRLRLTLDDDLQRYAREELERQLTLLQQLGPIAVEDEEGDVRTVPGGLPEGAVILMDARTGAILAAVSEPDADLELRDPTGDREQLRTWQVLRSHPGSTFKLVTSLAALESDDRDIRSLLRGDQPAGFALTGGVSLNGATLPGWTAEDRPVPLRVGLRNHKRHGVPAGTGLPVALEQSLNTYFGYLSLLMHRPVRERWAEAGVVGDETWSSLYPLYGAARRFGFDAPIDLVPDTLRGALAGQGVVRTAPSVDALGRTRAPGDVLVASPSRFPRSPMNAGEIANVGIGQGEVYATPLQMALVASVYATGGARPSPYLVEGIGATPRGEQARPPWSRVTDNQAAIELVRKGMKAVVEGGSAAGAFGDSPLAPHIYGKTGTAERPARGGGNVNDSWFVGYIVPPRPDASSPDVANHELAFACQIPAAGLGGRHAAEVIDRLLRDVARSYGWEYP